MATIKDVARLANVSTATVSRVINDNYPVNEETKKKVSEAIKELNYTPNAVARGLKRKETFLVGMVAPDISNPFFMEVAKGIESEIAKHGYNIVFCSSDEDEEKELQVIRMLHERQVDALILATRCTKSERLNAFVDDGMSIVMIDTKLSGTRADLITENSYEASYEAVEYAISKGHQKIGIINGIMSVSTSRDRYQAYRDALINNNLLINEDYEVQGDFNRNISYVNTKKMLNENKNDLPTLLFSANNYMTEGALIAIREMGLKIPDDISIISFGDLSVPKLIEPRLTVVEQSSYQIGKKAGGLLLSRLMDEIDKRIYKEIVIRLNLVEGKSVKTLHNME